MADSGHTTPRGGRKDLFGLRLEDAITKESEVIGTEIPNHEIPVVLELLALHIETRGRYSLLSKQEDSQKILAIFRLKTRILYIVLPY